MTTWMRWAAALVVLATAATATRADDDLAKLQGTWRAKVGRKVNVVALEIKDRSVSATIRTAQGIEFRAEGELRLDEAASPKVLDWVKFVTADGQPLPELLGIYRIDGDRLIIRSGGFNDRRPGEFTPGEGIWAGVLSFERE